MDRQFPIISDKRPIGAPTSVPWAIVEPHRERALRNHGQTLERLAERGGLSVVELLCVLEERRLTISALRDQERSLARLLALLGSV